MKNKTELSKMKKDALIAYILEIQENENISKYDDLKYDYDDLLDELSELEDKYDELENKLDNINDLDFMYDLRNSIDDLVYNVSRETITQYTNNLKIELDKLNSFILDLRGVEHKN